jgi:hypothetical protein
VDEISDEEFKKMILRIINEIKEDINIWMSSKKTQRAEWNK